MNSSFKSYTKGIYTGGFIPLTNFPAFTHYSASLSLAPFINNLYTYTIGIAAILAVIEIIWGGFLWMGSGASVTNKEEGRQKILKSILGLVLVLSPYIILSVINPNIISLKLGTNTININQKGVSKQAFSVAPANVVSTNTHVVPAPKKGCTIIHSGPFLEKAVCADADVAKQLQCGSGLKLQIQIASCPKESPSGQCLVPQNVTAYCTGINTTLEYYSYYHTLLGVVGYSGYIIPRDKHLRDTFVGKCTKDGGVVNYSSTISKEAVIVTHLFQIENTCPLNSGVVVDKSKGRGVICYGENLTCEPPTN